MFNRKSNSTNDEPKKINLDDLKAFSKARCEHRGVSYVIDLDDIFEIGKKSVWVYIPSVNKGKHVPIRDRSIETVINLCHNAAKTLINELLNSYREREYAFDYAHSDASKVMAGMHTEEDQDV